MIKSEAKKFMEEIMMIEKRQSQRLIGDITTGYRYVDTDTAERIYEAKRRKDEVDAMRYSLITDTLKTELNKIYGTAVYEKEKIYMLYTKMPNLEKFCNENDIYWSIDVDCLNPTTEERSYLYHFIHRPTNLKLNWKFEDYQLRSRCIFMFEDNIIRTLINKFHLIKKENKTMNYEQMYVRGSLFGKKNAEIKNVIFNGPCTIVQWSDGDKTIVKCENEDFDKEKGLAMAICKKFLGTNKSKSNYYDIFDKWIPEEKVVEEEKEKPIGIALSRYALKHGMNPSTLRKMCREGKIPAIKINGMWYIKSIEE